MILLLDTKSGLCRVGLADTSDVTWYEWQADRQLAKGLLAYLRDCLAKQGADFTSLTGIGAYQGPGSFTGLRIGLTVVNTIADDMKIPIVGTTGDTWAETALERLAAGETDRIVMPEYGADAHITTPRK